MCDCKSRRDPAPRNQNCLFSIDKVNRNIYIVDTSKIPSKCIYCGANVEFDNYILFYTTSSNIYTVHFGKTRLPTRILDLNILWYAETTYYFEPSFGSFVYGAIPSYVLYCPNKTITFSNNDCFIEIDNKPVCSFITQDNNYILVNSDGEIVESEIIFSNTKHEFKTKHGTLKAIQSEDELL
jgi:hypothetical protein